MDETVSGREGLDARSLSFRVDLSGEKLAGTWVETQARSEQNITVGAHFYRCRRAQADAVVPAIFFFNGGPGASSTPLHFSGFGPYLVEENDRGLADIQSNPDSLLDVADLIFIDPVGTGFNRMPMAGEAGQPAERLLCIDGDAELAALVVREWLAAFSSVQAPVFLCGQSYGGFRVATAAPYLDDLDLRGLVLISPALSMSARYEMLANDLAYVFTLPTMAVAAWHHGITQSDLDALALYRAVSEFAQNSYAPALLWGSNLDEARYASVAQQLTHWTGLPLQRVLGMNLRLDTEIFMRELLAPQPLRIGSLDVRGRGSLDPIADRPTNDPSLKLRKGAGRNEAYFREIFGIDAGSYTGLSFEVNGCWNWNREGLDRLLFVDATADLQQTMLAHEKLHVLGIAGVYDMSTPALATRHALTRPGLPASRIRILELESGHSPYEKPENRASVGLAIRRMLTAGSGN